MPWGVAAAAISAGGAVAASSASKSAANKQSDAATAASQLQQSQYQQTRNDQQPYRTAGGLALLQLQKGLGLSGAPGSGPDTSRANFNESAYLAANPDAQAWVQAQQQYGLGGSAYDHYIADGARRNDPSYFYNTADNGGTGGSSSGVGYGSLLKNFSMDDFQKDPGYQFVQDQGEKSINRGALAAGRYDSGAALKSLNTFNQGLASTQYQSAYDRYNQNQSKQFNELSGLSGTGQTATAATDAAGALAATNSGNALISAGRANAAGTVGSANAINNGISSGLNYWAGQNALSTMRGGGTSGNGLSWAGIGNWFTGASPTPYQDKKGGFADFANGYSSDGTTGVTGW